MIEYLLEATGMTMRFGGVTAIENVDFRLGYGELRCLIGPNGAGKSTFFKMLSGQLKPTSGNIIFKGQSLSGFSPARVARCGMGVKTQVPSVFDGLTVYENVKLASDRSLSPKRSRRRTQETLERMEIAHLGKSLVGALAHGQRQLVELAMVVAPQADLILLDEPAAGLTEDEVSRLERLVVQLSQSSSVIVVEHDMKFIRRIAKTVTVFNRGKILAEGPAELIMADQRVRDVYLGEDA